MQTKNKRKSIWELETICLLSKLNVKHHIEVELTMDEMDLTAAEKKASYEEISHNACRRRRQR